MSEWLIAMIVVYVLLIIGITVYSGLLLGTNETFLFDTPKELYDKTGMNWFGCILIWFLELLLNPIIWIFAIIIWFFNLLFTIGKK